MLRNSIEWFASQIINHLQFIFDYLSKLLTNITAERRERHRQKTQIELIYFIISLAPVAPFLFLFSLYSSSYKGWFNDLISGSFIYAEYTHSFYADGEE